MKVSLPDILYWEDQAVGNLPGLSHLTCNISQQLTGRYDKLKTAVL